jgi:spermidine synthase
MNYKLYAFFCNFFILTLGVSATITQILNIREFLVIFYGNELVIGMILGVWLAGISIGALIGSSTIDNIARPYNFLYPIAIIYIVLLPINIVFIRSIRYIFTIEAGQIFSLGTTILAAGICLAPLGAIIGFLFPLSVRVYRDKRYDGAVIIGRVYLIESLGSLFGGALFTYILVNNYNPFSIIALTGIVFLLPVLALILLDRQRLRKWFWGITATAVITILMHSIFSPVAAKMDRETWKRRWKGLNTGSELVFNADSKYQNIAIAESRNEYQLYLNCNYIGSFPDPSFVAPYAHLALSAHRKPDRVLIIGEGMPQIINEVMKHPVKKLDYVTIDPMLPASIRLYSKKIFDGRVQMHFQEGREYVKSIIRKKTIRYQLIIYEIPEPETAFLNRYYTTDFFSDLKQILASDGMVVLRATASSVHAGKITATYAASIYKSLRIVYPIVRLAPGETTVFFAGSDPSTVRLSSSLLKSRYRERGIHLDYFNPSQFNEMLSVEKIHYVTEQLQKQKGIRENTDLRPVTYYLNLILWDSYSDSQLGWMFRKLYTYGHRVLIPIITTFAIAWIVFHTYKKNKFDISNYLYIMFATGLWSLTEMLTIIFLYQNHFGYIYSDIGILVGLFMFGLSLGSYFTSQVLIEKPDLNAPNALIKSELLIACIITLELLLLILGLYDEKAVFIALILLCGIGTGVQYPLINKVLIEGGFTTGKTAGVIDSMDHLGAFLGAIATNIILIPLFGVAQALLILLMLKAAGTIPLYINRS